MSTPYVDDSRSLPFWALCSKLWLAAAAVSIAGAFVWPGPLQAEPSSYSEAVEQAAKLEADGKPGEAYDLLEPFIEARDGDYALRVELASLAFKASRYPVAAKHFERAARLSSGAIRPRVGLGWSHYHLADYDRAVRIFSAVLFDDPNNESASTGLDLARSATENESFEVDLRGEFRFFNGHPTRAASNGTLLRAEGLVEPFSAGGAFRLRYVTPPADRAANYTDRIQGDGREPGSLSTTTLPPGPPDPAGAFTQYELYGHAGLHWPDVGFDLHTGYLAPLEIDWSQGIIAGGVARFRPFGEFTLEGSHTFYDDGDVTRLAVSWRTPRPSEIWLQPGFAAQRIEGRDELLTNVSLDGGLNWQVLEFWAGAKLGDEYRPVYLDVPTVRNLAGRIEWGLSAGTGLDLGTFALRLGWKMYRETRKSPESYTADAHLLHLGMTLASW